MEFAHNTMDIPGAGWAKKSVFQLGKGKKKTLAVSMEMHALSREKVCSILKGKNETGIILMQGGEEQNMYDTDTEVLFR